MNQRFTRAGLVAVSVLLAGALGACSMFGGDKSGVGTGKDVTRCPSAERMVVATGSDYGQRFMARFSKKISYPSEALEARQMGNVQMCARLTRDGKVLEGRIDQGSGYPILDGVALLAVGQLIAAKDADPIPKDFAHGQDAVWLSFPVSFKPPTEDAARFIAVPAERPCKDTGSKEGDIDAQQVTLKEWGDFPGIFSDAIKQELIYPAPALEAKQTGYTLLCVSLDRDAHLIGASISQSSGSALLDGASLIALGMMQVRQHMPPVPDRVRQAHDRVTFTQEIEWKPGEKQ